MSLPFFVLNSSVGPANLAIDLTATTFSLKLTLNSGGVYFATDLKIDWAPEVLTQFGSEVLNLDNWKGVMAVPPNFDQTPVSITRVDATKLQIRVGYGDRTPKSLIFNGIITLDTRDVPVTNPSQQLSSLLKVGTRISLVPVNFQSMYVGHFLFGLINRNPEATALFKQDCTFEVKAALSGDKNYISLHSVNHDRYVNHYAGALNLNPLEANDTFKQNASFYPAVGSAGSNSVTLISRNFNGYAVRHFLHRLVINPMENTPQFRNDSSFIVKPALAR